MDDVRNELQKAIEAFKESMNAYRQLQQKKVSDADCKKFFLNVLQATEQEEEYRSAGRLLSKPSEQEEVMAELLRKQSAERESIGEELVKTPRALAELERIYRHAPGASLARDTAWGAYNAVTYWVDHTRGRDNTRLEQSWIGAGSMIRDRAFDLAMQMT